MGVRLMSPHRHAVPCNELTVGEGAETSSAAPVGAPHARIVEGGS